MYYRVDVTTLKVVRRKASNKPRQAAIYLACKFSGCKYKTIADEFSNITVRGVAKIFQRITQEIAINNTLHKEITLLENRLMSFVKT